MQISGKDRCQTLLDDGIKLAEKMLFEYGEFHPYGYAMNSMQKLVSVSLDSGEENPSSEKAVEALAEVFTKEAEKGTYITTAIFYDVKVNVDDSSMVDSIAVALDDVDGYSRIVLKPYEIANDFVKFDPLVATPGENRIFRI